MQKLYNLHKILGYTIYKRVCLEALTRNITSLEAYSFECEKFSVLNSELQFENDAHGRGRKAESSQVILTSSLLSR